jgi:hypothetical protein
MTKIQSPRHAATDLYFCALPEPTETIRCLYLGGPMGDSKDSENDDSDAPLNSASEASSRHPSQRLEAFFWRCQIKRNGEKPPPPSNDASLFEFVLCR